MRRISRTSDLLALVLGALWLFHAAPTAAQQTLRPATLTVGQDDFGSGCSNSSGLPTACSGQSIDDDFVHGGATYAQHGAGLDVGVPPSAPPDPVASVSITHKGNSLAASWDPPAGATHYDVTYSGNGQDAMAAWNRAGTSLTITCDSRYPGQYQHCIDGGATYTVGVRARNAAGESVWVNSAPAARSVLSVASATVGEPGAGASAALGFVVTLAPAASGTVTVDYATRNGTATAGADYTATTGTLSFAAGETEKTISVPVLADAHTDGGETLTLTLSNAQGASIADARATGTITDDDPIPAAWAGRFGRAIADQVLEAVEARMVAVSALGATASLAGRQIGGDDEALLGARRLAGLLDFGAGGRSAPRPASGTLASARFGLHALTPHELLTGSSFSLTSETGVGGLVSLWGRGAVTRFDGREAALSFNGDVATGMFGGDWSSEAAPVSGWRVGLLLSYSIGTGDYGGSGGERTSGEVEASLIGLFPWASRALGERVKAWGAVGHGLGELTLTPRGRRLLEADLELWMAAAGLHGTLLNGGRNRLTLTVKTDGVAVRTAAGEVRGAVRRLPATHITVTRLRLGLEARRPVAVGDMVLTPLLEAGLRHDDGDAERGFGTDVIGGFLLSAPAFGLETEIRARGLLSHESGDFRESGLSGTLSWQQHPASDRGASVSLTQTLGTPSSGGAEALLSRFAPDGLVPASHETVSGFGAGLKGRRLDAVLGYGLPAFNNRLTLTPEAVAGLSDVWRDYRFGLRLAPAAAPRPFDLTVEAAWREAAHSPDGSGTGSSELAVGIRLNARF
ncbi:MAG: hypothetical protein OXP66_06480 [Candidatus Tectomicrobia bacterium]|nr:hypothetical protein [Candidatus Tectomicrobia bacterium]